VAILLLFANTLLFVPVAPWIKAIVTATGLAILAFIWTRPSEPVSEWPKEPAPLRGVVL
jgi:hypothetical protein